MKMLNPHWTVKGFNGFGEEVGRFEQSSVEQPSEELITDFVNENLAVTRVEVNKSYHVYSDIVHEGMPKLLTE